MLLFTKYLLIKMGMEPRQLEGVTLRQMWGLILMIFLSPIALLGNVFGSAYLGVNPEKAKNMSILEIMLRIAIWVCSFRISSRF